MEHRVILIGEDIDLLDELRHALREEGFAATMLAGESLDEIDCSLEGEVHSVVVDLGQTECKQLSLCRHVRTRVDAPIILLCAEGSAERERIAALDAGVDDCLVKPVSPELVVAHVRARLERRMRQPAEATANGVLDFGELEIDIPRRQVRVRGKTPHLTPKEFDLLVTLARNEGRALRTAELLKEVWGYDKACSTRTLDVHVSRLRAKIERHQGDPQLIVTVPCVGYRFDRPLRTVNRPDPVPERGSRLVRAIQLPEEQNSPGSSRN